MSHSFRSIPNAPKSPRQWTEADIVAIARQLLDEHAASREAATQAANLVCGNCAGSGMTVSTLMPGESVSCFACAGTGKPNDTVTALPALTAADHERLWKIRQLLLGRYRFAVLAVIREYFPDMYRETEAAQPH